MRTSTTFDPGALFASLNANGVRFVIIGGIAASAHGAGWPTLDVDIVVASDDENLEAVLESLRDLDAEYDTLHSPPIVPDIDRLRTYSGPQLFRTKHGRLDVLKEAGGDTYDTLMVDAHEVVVSGIAVACASVEALIRMKRAAGRPKDAVGLALLEKLRAGRRG